MPLKPFQPNRGRRVASELMVEPTAADPLVRQPRYAGFGRLARDSAIYVLGSAVGKAIGILLLPLLTRALPRAEFGRLDLLSTVQSAAASLLLLGLDLGATRLFADLPEEERRRLFPTWLGITGLALGPLAIAMVLAAKPLSRAIFDDGDYATAIVLTAVAIIGSTIQVVALTALRNRNRPKAYALVSGSSLVANGLFIVAVIPSRPTATAVVGAMAASMCLGAVIGILLARGDFSAGPRAALGRRLLVLGLPAAPAVAAIWVAELVNRGILLSTTSEEELAYFSVSTRFSSVAVLLVLGFQMAWQPAAFGLGTSEPALQRIADDGRRILTVVAATVVAVAAITPELIVAISGEEYRPAIRPIGFALVFAMGYSAYQAAIMPSAISRRLRDVGASALVATVTGVACNAWWAPSRGSWGTAAAVAVGQFVGAGTALLLARSRVLVPYAWGRVGVVTAAAIAATLAATFPAGGAAPEQRAAVAVGFGVVLAVDLAIHRRCARTVRPIPYD